MHYLLYSEMKISGFYTKDALNNVRAFHAVDHIDGNDYNPVTQQIISMHDI